MLGGRKWCHFEHMRAGKSENFAGLRGASLHLRFTLAGPHHERASDPQQRRRVFGDHIQRSERASRDDILADFPGCPSLGSVVHDASVVHARHLDRSADERRLSSVALNEGYASGWERHREDQARDARPGTQVCDRRGGSDLGHFQRHQRVGDMHIDGCDGITNGRWWCRVACDQL